MTLKQFCEKHGLDKPAVQRSKKNNYEGTNTKITWMQLSDEVDDQDVLVMSASLAAEYEKDKSILKTAQVKKTSEGWGLIRPSSVDDLGTDYEW